jgi:hypothetical protein
MSRKHFIILPYHITYENLEKKGGEKQNFSQAFLLTMANGVLRRRRVFLHNYNNDTHFIAYMIFLSKLQ